MPSEESNDEVADTAIDGANQGGASSRAAMAQGLPAVGPDYVEETHGDAIDNAVPTYGYRQLPVVALGASAGGIQALKLFFAALPPETGAAYVVILHLSPEHESTLPALLGNVTSLPVKAVQDGERLRPDHVYVIPPARQLTVINGHLRLSPLESERGRRVVVDLFFRSLADAHGPHATAVVLSGADGDGAIGIKRIKERGGLTIAQEPSEAEYDSMPRSSIATGMVDWVLRVADMPARILDYSANKHRLRLPPEDGPQPAKPAAPPQDEEEAALREVLVFLRMRTGNDFTYYKRATILRRIARRMQVNGISTLLEYLFTLRTHAGEAAALLQDLLISVTNFFRDREAFAVVETRIPDLFAGKGPEDTVRVWCAACATGEEPYSMAMLLTEHARTLPHPPMIQVFGCDLDAQSIQIARAGVYPAAISADVSEERIARFFIKEPRGYQVRRELREIVLFAEHDLLKDAPFSRLDLVSCRNLLIYLERDAQARALEIFHFALKPDGLLFLGSAESVDEERGLFAPLDKRHRLYVRRPTLHVGLPVPTGTGTLLRALQAQSKEAPVLPSPTFNRVPAGPFAPALILSPSEERAALADLHFRLTERYAPPSVIVNAEGDIVHLSENAGRFLRPAGGQPSANLLRSVHPTLRMDLHAALLRMAETGAPVEVFGLPVEMEGGAKLVDLHVAPAAELAPGYVLVSFDARARDTAVAAADVTVFARPEAEAVVRHLEHELEQARTRLRDTVERFGATEEEYKSSNEELQSMNEELRSASEELETSREELQSINEELTTVNLQFKSNVEELAHANSDLHNLMNATSIATVFLDRELRVTRFTPEAVAIFHLIPSDAGRPLADLKQRIDYPGMEADARQILRTLVPLEREVGDLGGGNWFLARLSPYRSLEERIEGVVLTFVDITERRHAEEARRESEEKYRTLFDSMDEGYCIIQMLHDVDGKPVDFRYIEVNPAFEKHNGLTNATGKTIRELAPGIEGKWVEIYGRVAASGESVRFEESSPALDGRTFDLYAFRVGNPAERKVAVLFTDITGRRQGETQQAFLLRLNDALRAHADPVELQAAVTGIVMEHFAANRCYYCEIEGNKAVIRRDAFHGDLPSVAGVYPLDDFPLFKTMMNGGAPLVVPDTNVTDRLDAELKGLCLQMKINSFINVPVMKDNRYAGNLCITRSEPKSWADSEVKLAQEIAERTWAAVERARAEEALRESEAWLAGQKEAFQSATRGAPLGNSLDALVRTAAAQMGEDCRCAFYIANDAGTELRLAAGMSEAYAAHMDGFKIAADSLACGLATYTGQPVITPDVTQEPRWKDWRWMAEQHGYRAVWSFPIETTEGKPIGTFAMYFGAPRAATPRDFEFAAVLTRAGSIIISRSQEIEQRARAEEAVRASEARLAVELADTQQLQRISSALVEEGNTDALYAQVLEAACAVMRADFASLQIIVPDQNALRLLAHNGFAPASAKHWEWVRLDDTSSCGLAMTDQHRISVPDVERWEFIAGTEDLAQYRLSGIRAMQSTRLVSRGGSLVGMISTHWRGVHQPSERELGLFDVLARQAADLIERRIAGEALRASEQRLRTLADAVPQIIWTNSGDGVANYFNRRWHEYSGLTHEQSHGLSWQAIVHPDDAPRSVPAWKKALAAGAIFDTEYRLRGADGVYRWFIGRNVPLKDEADRVLGWFGSATDIHDLKEAEQETERARARAEAADQAKDHFLAVLSHELRTPLMPIIMALAVLARRQDLPEAVTRTFAMIQRNVELEARFIDDLLDVTRIERGKMEITRANINLYEAIAGAVEVSTPEIEAKGQRLTVTLEGAECPFHGDLARLQQVFWNLLKNASKFTPPGGAIEVRSSCQVGDEFVVEVADTGIGLEAEAIERIFQPFEQASVSITREFGGLGLGLAIARATVEAHGGTLRVSSPGLGQGATFTVSLPLVAAVADTVKTTV